MIDIIQLGGARRESIRTAPFIVLPVGSIEYHGPHAPLGTDTTLAVGFAKRLCERFSAILLPPVTYTFAPSITSRHLGTVSISPDVFLEYLYQVLLALAANGARRIVALNGHSENQFALRLAAERLALEYPESSVLYVNWWKLVGIGRDAPSEGLFTDHGGHGHGGPLEISTVAAFDPSGVEPHLATNIEYESPWWRVAGQAVGVGQEPEGFSGFHGRVDEIDPAKGEVLVDEVSENLARMVEEWLERTS